MDNINVKRNTITIVIVIHICKLNYNCKQLKQEPKQQTSSSKKILLPLTGFFTLVGGVFWTWYSIVGFSTASAVDLQIGIRKSIAIINFENLTGNKEGDFFCSALTEQIRGSLTKLGKLDVASRLISGTLNRSNVNNDVYNKFDFYVEGTLSKVADNSNINISLIDAKHHKVLFLTLDFRLP